NQALSQLESTHQGLTPHQASVRLKHYGFNELSVKKTPWLKRLLEPFASYFAMVIVLAALLSLYERKWFEAAIISIILIVNAIIFYFQQFSVGRVLKALRKQDSQNVDV